MVGDVVLYIGANGLFCESGSKYLYTELDTGEVLDIVDDTKSIAINIIAQGIADIVVTNYPSEVESGVSFDLTYSVTNLGGADTLWGEHYEGAVPITGTEWAEQFGVGETKNKVISFPNGITEPLVAELKVGHEE